MGKEVKKQHYVPRFYLKNFVGKGGKIFVYDKKEGKSFPANLTDVAQERYFYGLPEFTEGKDKLNEAGLSEKFMIENIMQEYDDMCAPALAQFVQNIEASKFISRRGEILFKPSIEQKMGLSFFMVFQGLRTKETREKIAQMNHLMTESIAEMSAKIKYPEIDMDQYMVQTDSNYDSVFHSQLLLDQDQLEGLARVCTFGRIWRIGINNTQTPFLLSDHPVIMKSHDPEKFFRGTGWMSPYLEIAMPLTPKLVVFLTCPLVDRNKYKFGMEWSLNNTIVEMTEDNVLHYNSTQCSNSYRFLFSSTDDWEMAEEYLQEFPQYRDPTRQKVSASGLGKKRTLRSNWRMSKSDKHHSKT